MHPTCHFHSALEEKLEKHFSQKALGPLGVDIRQWVELGLGAIELSLVPDIISSTRQT